MLEPNEMYLSKAIETYKNALSKYKYQSPTIIRKCEKIAEQTALKWVKMHHPNSDWVQPRIDFSGECFSTSPIFNR